MVLNAFLDQKILPLKKKIVIFLQHTLTHFCLKEFPMLLVADFTKSNYEVAGGPRSVFFLFAPRNLQNESCTTSESFSDSLWEGQMGFLDCM